MMLRLVDEVPPTDLYKSNEIGPLVAKSKSSLSGSPGVSGAVGESVKALGPWAGFGIVELGGVAEVAGSEDAALVLRGDDIELPLEDAMAPGTEDPPLITNGPEVAGDELDVLLHKLTGSISA